MAFTEDRSVFFDTDDFATAGTVGTSTINGIFDREYVLQGGQVAGANPIFLIDTSDAGAVGVGSTIVIGTGTYTVKSKEPQDDGNTTLLQL